MSVCGGIVHEAWKNIAHFYTAHLNISTISVMNQFLNSNLENVGFFPSHVGHYLAQLAQSSVNSPSPLTQESRRGFSQAPTGL